jgi:hypothetical protein
VLVIDAQGVELASAGAIEEATRAARALPGAVAVVGLDVAGRATLLARCGRAASAPSEAQCSAAVRRWRERAGSMAAGACG